MITNPQDYIFYSDFQYPPKISSGSTNVAAGDFGQKILATGITLDNDWLVYEESQRGGETVISKHSNAYINHRGELISSATYTPSKLIWRVYGY